MSDLQQIPTPQPRMSRGLRAVFFLSLALNLAVAGVVIGVLANGGPLREERRPPRGADAGFGVLTQALSKEDRREIGSNMRRAAQEENLTRAGTRRQFEAIAQTLETEPFDAEVFAQQVAQQRATAGRLMDIAQEALAARVAQMSAAERTLLAQRLREAASRRPGRKPGPARSGD